MTALLFILGIIIPIVLAEFTDWLPRLSHRMVLRTASHLGDDQLTERYAEEWSAELNDVPGKISKLVFALGIRLHLRGILKEARLRAGLSNMAVEAEELEQPSSLHSFCITIEPTTPEPQIVIKAMRVALEDLKQRHHLNDMVISVTKYSIEGWYDREHHPVDVLSQLPEFTLDLAGYRHASRVEEISNTSPPTEE